MPNDRPNLLLITTDQQRFDTIACAGNGCIFTPHLDWLCETGIRFSRCYSDGPVCLPARSTILTGLHARNLPQGIGGFHQPTAPDAKSTLPAVLTRAGYQTKAVGKMHYTPERATYGWESVENLEDYYREMAGHPERGIPMHHGLGQNEATPAISSVHESHSLTHWTVERSINFLKGRDPTRPFCLNTSFSKPHPPFDPPFNFWALYDGIALPVPVYGDWSRNADDIAAGWMQPTWGLNGVDRFSPAQIKQMRRAYYALITHIDYALGLLFSHLREHNLLENTFIVFTSDHGEMLGDHHMGAKSVMFEGSAHVPMIARPPQGVLSAQRGAVCEALTSLADIFPTFCAAASIPNSELPQHDGIDIIAAAAGAKGREHLVCSHGAYHAVVEGSFKYHYCDHDGAELLFDLSRDPLEQSNLISASKHQKQHSRMRHILIAEMEKAHVPAVSNGELITLSAPRNRQQVRANAWPGYHSRGNPPFDVLH